MDANEDGIRNKFYYFLLISLKIRLFLEVIFRFYCRLQSKGSRNFAIPLTFLIIFGIDLRVEA